MKNFVKKITPNVIKRDIKRVIWVSNNPFLFASQNSLFNRFVQQFIKPKGPPILLISLPRGGSSWIGDTLGRSSLALYLREPITQSYIREIGAGPSFFEYEKCKDKSRYKRFTSDAFQGIPSFNSSIITYPKQWLFCDRIKKRIVIKEVNPLVLRMVLEKYHPRVVYLLRHPVPVAHSFFVQGWVGDQYQGRYSDESLNRFRLKYGNYEQGSFWEQMGSLQAIAQNETLETLSKYSDHTVIQYENFCVQPLQQFRKLFEFCELPFSNELAEHIENSTSSSEKYVTGEYSLARDSKNMLDRWKFEVSKEHISQLRKSYLANTPKYYADNSQW